MITLPLRSFVGGPVFKEVDEMSEIAIENRETDRVNNQFVRSILNLDG